MDKTLVTSSVAVPLLIALISAIWFLVANSRKKKRKHAPTDHVFRGQGEAVTVAELLEEAIEHGDGIRLNWSKDDLDALGRVRPHVQDEFPTAVLPRVEEERQEK